MTLMSHLYNINLPLCKDCTTYELSLLATQQEMIMKGNSNGLMCSFQSPPTLGSEPESLVVQQCSCLSIFITQQTCHLVSLRGADRQ